MFRCQPLSISEDIMSRLTALIVLLQTPFVLSCTTLIAGRKATVDGSTMASHSNDGGGTTDARLFFVAAKDWPENSVRPVFPSPE